MRDGRVLTTRIEVHTYLGLNVLSFCSRGGGVAMAAPVAPMVPALNIITTVAFS